MREILQSIRRVRRGRTTRAWHPPWRVLGTAALAVLIAVSGWLAVRTFVLSDAMRVRKVELSGVERLDPRELDAALTDAIGRPLLLFEVEILRMQLEAVPGVASAVVARRLPDTIDVRISERTAVARTELGRRSLFVDASGALFSPVRALPGDADLPRLRGLRTAADAIRLSAADEPALRALEALTRITGRRPPAGTIVDLTPEDRILLRPGPDAPALWLDRDEPELNLESLFANEQTVARIARVRAIDLRFPHRLTVVPHGGGTTTR
ncbi:MAG: FtsQ-type POTRA domain-containing protein [Acidobacteriota bacterium]|nr:FtsQ-type POTRA domain-containing protein [Acidobacteriota bacterium]